jgi:hypothetical protein
MRSAFMGASGEFAQHREQSSQKTAPAITRGCFADLYFATGGLLVLPLFLVVFHVHSGAFFRLSLVALT